MKTRPDELDALPLDATIVYAAGRVFAKVDDQWHTQTLAGTWRPAAWLVRGLADRLLDHIEILETYCPIDHTECFDHTEEAQCPNRSPHPSTDPNSTQSSSPPPLTHCETWDSLTPNAEDQGLTHLTSSASPE